MYVMKKFLGERFERIQTIVNNEYGLINNYANLIGSANYPFPSVLRAMDTPFNLNPSEGSRGKRYFPLCDSIDDLEILGEDLLYNLFDCRGYYTNLEPYSGTQANHIVYQAVLRSGECVVAMNPNAGGHVSHYFYLKEHYSLYEYGITNNEEINYEEIEYLCQSVHPKLLIAGSSSFPRSIDYQKISEICKKYGVLLLADISHTVIYIAAGRHPSPFGVADFITFTTHKTTRGIRGGIIMCQQEHKKKIERATFPIEQGAPKFNEVLAKTIMLTELNNINLKEYVSEILKISRYFSNVFISNGLKLYTGGTDSHLIMIDLDKQDLSGKEYETLLCKEHILVNRNILPNDKRPAFETSGIRLGILTLATLNMVEADYHKIADVIANTIKDNSIVDPMSISEIMKKYHIAY